MSSITLEKFKEARDFLWELSYIIIPRVANTESDVTQEEVIFDVTSTHLVETNFLLSIFLEVNSLTVSEFDELIRDLIVINQENRVLVGLSLYWNASKTIQKMSEVTSTRILNNIMNAIKTTNQ